jgi:DNA polymerase-3 subunit gamma/tau
MSETFQVTARKWRPMRFDDVVGQDHVTRTLKNALREGRLAHAYLFTGQRGCGKTTVARILAKAINCPNAATNGYEPCNHCDVCLSITEGRSMDVAEIDGASNNGVDDVRMLRDNVKYPPLVGQYKVIIIDEVHMLSTSAFNALLKTLEEPPKHLIFIFATTEAQKVLPTILSRTQRYDFRRIQLDEIISNLRTIANTDGITIEDDALLIIAKKADGSMRDAQSIFDQVVAYCGMTVETERVRDALNLIDLDFYFAVTDAASQRDPKKAFELSGQVVSRGYDVEEFFIGLLEHFRNILTVLITSNTKLIEVSKSHQERYVAIASNFAEGDLLRLIRLGQNALEKLRTAQQPRIVLEVALVEMMMLERALEITQLLEAIRGLKNAPLPVPTETAPAARPIPATSQKSNGRALTEGPKKPELPTTSLPPSAPASTVENDDVTRRWKDLGEFIKTKSKPLHSIFPDIEFCGVRRQTLYLGVPGKIEHEMLLSMKSEMTHAISEFFGLSLQFEAGKKQEMQVKAGSPVVKNPEIESIPANKPLGNDRSELELALIEQLGAQEV